MRIRTSILAGVAAASLLSAPAFAYVPNGANFAELAGSAADATVRDSILEPAAYALYSRIYAVKGISDRDAAGIAAFYGARDYKPAWTQDGKLTPTAQALIGRMAKAEEDGLDPKAFAFAMPDLASGEDAVSDAEVHLSLALVTYARQAQIGRINPSSIDENIAFEPVAPNPSEVLAALYASAKPAETLDAYNPPHPEFKRLKAKLAELRASNEKMPEPVPAGPTIKLNMKDARVPLIRTRLGLEQGDSPTVYDQAVSDAVKAFQKKEDIGVDGNVGPGTLAAFNKGIVGDRIGEIVANMERWRWEPRDFGRFYVMVDVPGYNVRVYKDGAKFFETRIVVGKPENMTPIFSDNIQYVVVNPFWNVPVSITTKEMLPQIRRDPSSLMRANYEVLTNVGGRYQIVDPRTVDWNNVDMNHVQIRQRPGDDNALGNIKFMFPNKYSVYLHDTPSKSLFARDYRALSHGCMRVQDPFAFADALLSEDSGLNAAKIKRLIGGSEQQLNMSKHVPVHITYFTALVDDSGKLEFRQDIYGHSAKVRKALGFAG